MGVTLLCSQGISSIPIKSPCTWAQDDCSDPEYTWNGAYPLCALYDRKDGSPIPCQGLVGEDYCVFEGKGRTERPPRPASWHVHVFFPNPTCTNCSRDLLREGANFTFAGAMQLRAIISERLNELTEEIKGHPADDPIDVGQALSDVDYNQCGNSYGIVAGAPANYHQEPCIFEVDAVKKGGPFTDPETMLGYPNYSFLIPGGFWMPGLLDKLRSFLLELRANRQEFSKYPLLFHPNSGCEVRDHAEKQSIEWHGGRGVDEGYPLLTRVFSCRALGCNQACTGGGAADNEFPANCSVTL